MKKQKRKIERFMWLETDDNSNSKKRTSGGHKEFCVVTYTLSDSETENGDEKMEKSTRMVRIK